MDEQLEANKRVVVGFFHKAFIERDPEKAVQLYVGENYTQHNPLWPDGKEAFIQFAKQLGKDNPNRQFEIKRVIAEGDYVVLHVYQSLAMSDKERYLAPKGKAVIDIFRVENNKIVEHWDVVQVVPSKCANTNGMF